MKKRLSRAMMLALAVLVGAAALIGCGEKGDKKTCEDYKAVMTDYIENKADEAAELMADFIIESMKGDMSEEEMEKAALEALTKAAGVPVECIEEWKAQDWEPDMESDAFEKAMMKQMGRIMGAVFGGGMGDMIEGMGEGMEDMFAGLGDELGAAFDDWEAEIDASFADLEAEIDASFADLEAEFDASFDELEAEYAAEPMDAAALSVDECAEFLDDWEDENPDASAEFFDRIGAVIGDMMDKASELQEADPELTGDELLDALESPIYEIMGLVEGVLVQVFEAPGAPQSCVGIMMDELRDELRRDMAEMVEQVKVD